jgi:hypothetical protein
VVVLFSGTGCVVVGVLQSRTMGAHRRGQATLPIQRGNKPLAVFSSSSFLPSPIEFVHRSFGQSGQERLSWQCALCLSL